ncbi:MAG: BolA/IbaG family iron-sulfur metabolism protein [Deltaproteobacteria bacterium]|nr:BolA/IbaG family iron-sulfur metabolism protein [Deltaproteobacteria bacterium]MBW2421006.1 BolA/IbaG family iron-sulfur metabolism protein [Deltaproteobacteria bacterium]
MALQIINAGPDPEETCAQIRECIAEAIEGAEIEVHSPSAGHFEIKVLSAAFEDLSRVKQQQLVYGAIAHLMSGTTPPVHAVDRLQCLVG